MPLTPELKRAFSAIFALTPYAVDPGVEDEPMRHYEVFSLRVWAQKILGPHVVANGKCMMCTCIASTHSVSFLGNEANMGQVIANRHDHLHPHDLIVRIIIYMLQLAHLRVHLLIRDPRRKGSGAVFGDTRS